MGTSFREASPAGTPRGTVVLIHGFPFHGGMWAPQMEALAGQGWRVLAPDLRGFGATGLHDPAGEVPAGHRSGGGVARDDEAVLTMSCLADDVAALIDEQADGSAVVCGFSMGGYVAFELWRRHPDRIRALVLADTRAQADSDEGRDNRARTAQAVRRSGAEPVADAMLPALLAEATRTRAPELVRDVREMILGARPDTLIAALAGMAARHDVTAELAGISVPALVVVGEHDAITPPDVARAMAEAIPGASLREIPDTGHMSNLEDPGTFNRALTAFLEGLQEPG